MLEGYVMLVCVRCDNRVEAQQHPGITGRVDSGST